MSVILCVLDQKARTEGLGAFHLQPFSFVGTLHTISHSSPQRCFERVGATVSTRRVFIGPVFGDRALSPVLPARSKKRKEEILWAG